jgi:hypothetical protein
MSKEVDQLNGKKLKFKNDKISEDIKLFKKNENKKFSNTLSKFKNLKIERQKFNNSIELELSSMDFNSDNFLEIGWSDSELYKKDPIDSENQDFLVDTDTSSSANLGSINKNIGNSLIKSKKNPVKRLTFKLKEIVSFHTLMKMTDF